MVEDGDAVGDLHRLLLVVGDEDGRHVHLLVEPAEPVAQLGADPCIERAERLVEEEHAGLRGERASKGHPLPLAARELCGIPVGVALQLDELEELVDTRADLLLRPLPDRQREADVVAHGHVLERGVVLEDEADVAVLRGQAGRVLAGEEHPPRVGPFEAGDDPQQGRLAGAARAEQGGEGALGDLERDVVDGEESPKRFVMLRTSIDI